MNVVWVIIACIACILFAAYLEARRISYQLQHITVVMDGQN